MKEKCAYTNLEFPIVLLTKNERRILAFWCPTTLAMIDETNKFELIELWRKPGKASWRGQWFQVVRSWPGTQSADRKSEAATQC